MRNVKPSVLTALPHARPLADLERAYHARRVTLAQQADAQLIAARQLYARVELELAGVLQPPVRRRRDGRGRFLSRAWLHAAESYGPTDLAWFRHPVSGGR